MIYLRNTDYTSPFKTFLVAGLMILLAACVNQENVRHEVITTAPVNKPGQQFDFSFPGGHFQVDHRDGQYQIEVSQYANPPKVSGNNKYHKADNMVAVPGFGLVLWNQPKMPSEYAALKKPDYTQFYYFVDAATGKYTTCHGSNRNRDYWKCLALGTTKINTTNDGPPKTQRVVLMMSHCHYSNNILVCDVPPQVKLIEGGQIKQQWTPLTHTYYDDWYRWVDDRVLFMTQDEDGTPWGHWVNRQGEIVSIPGYEKVAFDKSENSEWWSSDDNAKRRVILEPDELGGYGIINEKGRWIPDGAVTLYPTIRTKHYPKNSASRAFGWFVAYPNKNKDGIIWGWASPGFKTLGAPVWSELRVVDAEVDFYGNETYDLFMLKNIQDNLWYAYQPPEAKFQYADIKKYAINAKGYVDFNIALEKARKAINTNTAFTRKGEKLAEELRVQRLQEQRAQRNITIQKQIDASYARHQQEIERQNTYTSARRAGKDKSSLSDQALKNYKSMHQENFKRYMNGEQPWRSIWSSSTGR